MKTVSTALATAAILVVLVAPSEAGEPRATAEKSLPNPFFAFDNCLRGVADAPAVLRDIGYDGMGTSGFDVADDVRRCREAGLELFSTYVGCRLDRSPPYDPALEKAVRDLEGTGAFLWLTVTGGRRGEEDEKAAAVVGEIADAAAKRGLRVALYPHTGFYVATTADALRLARKADRENLGVSINLCHELMTGRGAELDATIRDAMPLLYLVSINGADRKQSGFGWDRLIRPLGEGDFDVLSFLRKIRDGGYKGPIGLQCYGVKGDPVENLKRSMRAWKAYSTRLARKEAKEGSREKETPAPAGGKRR